VEDIFWFISVVFPEYLVGAAVNEVPVIYPVSVFQVEFNYSFLILFISLLVLINKDEDCDLPVFMDLTV